ncbi:hypothetical protein [Microbacterium suwonense]|uniref:Uncharacterized protein n=1 Tax=Microbacterium suwonense TaxID=683047 RepID=A0ABN6X4T1_9MICO|nr:hypothetical protein [Microbacterium suwonense]BDZ39582.1 hypothetical protein GCM10025863_21960 [Microbacterium suwonense]
MQEGGVAGVTVVDIPREWAELTDSLTTRLVLGAEQDSRAGRDSPRSRASTTSGARR